jgi:transcriptional regulator with XRE-family HTH domain
MLNMQELGKRIVTTREKIGWSQRELVRISGVGQNNLSALEQGKKPLFDWRRLSASLLITS